MKKKFVMKKKTPVQTQQKEILPQKNEPLSYEKEKTLKILSSVKPGLAVKDIVESMTNFYFVGSQVVTYNDKISIMHPFKTPFSAFIKADTLYSIISKLPSDKFTMEKKDEKVLLKAKGVNIKLPVIFDDEIVGRIKIVKKGMNSVEWKELPENFSECIKLCSFAASKSESESVISCVKVEGNKCAATDNKRIAYAILKSELPGCSLRQQKLKTY